MEKLRTSFTNIGEMLGMNVDPNSGLIFITGGNGPIGHRVATKLLDAGYAHLRLGAHRVTEMEDKGEKGAEIADFHWEHQETYEKALDGVKTVFCTVPYHRNWKVHFDPFLAACKKAGVKHFVKLSFYHARTSGDPFQQVPLVRDHGDCDEKLATSGISYTILAASHLMSNPMVFQGMELRAADKPSVMYGASANKPVNYVSPNDIADCAVRAILEPTAHRNKEYTLTGSIGITEGQTCLLLSDFLKKEVTYVDQVAQEFEQSERKGGDPEWMVEDLMSLEAVKASGYEADTNFPSHDIETICGHEPETFAMYLRATDAMSKVEMAF